MHMLWNIFFTISHGVIWYQHWGMVIYMYINVNFDDICDLKAVAFVLILYYFICKHIILIFCNIYQIMQCWIMWCKRFGIATYEKVVDLKLSHVVGMIVTSPPV